MNPTIEMKEQFQRELNSLHEKLDKKLTEVDSSTRTKDLNHKAYKATIEQLNLLKIHRLKIRAAWEWLRRASENEWIEQKERLHKKYKKALQLVN